MLWEWYVGFRRLGKPVEMVFMPDAGHVVIRPQDRVVSQGGAVDWFDFWLKGEEDQDPAKTKQYARWRELRKLQEQNEKKSANAASSTHGAAQQQVCSGRLQLTIYVILAPCPPEP
jgi:hypothetical protein